jgi:ethanolamine utilization microcompartment shell protein EutS
VNNTATCSTDILHPAIDIDKTVSDDSVTPGTTVTYTFVVTNTGDTTLFDIVVTDDVMGEIGTIDQLEPGESATLTADFVVGDVAVTNVAVARGHDILGRVVEASDDANVTVVLVETPTTPPPPTPFTGSDAGRLGLLAALAFGIGLTVVAATRRRRSGEVS